MVRIPAGPANQATAGEGGSDALALGSAEDASRDESRGANDLAAIEEGLGAGERPALLLQEMPGSAHHPVAHDPPRLRVHGKKAPIAKVHAAMCGESNQGSYHELG